MEDLKANVKAGTIKSVFTLLHEYAQQCIGGSPVYEYLFKNRLHSVSVHILGKEYGSAQDVNKKKAKLLAAETVLRKEIPEILQMFQHRRTDADQGDHASLQVDIGPGNFLTEHRFHPYSRPISKDSRPSPVLPIADVNMSAISEQILPLIDNGNIGNFHETLREICRLKCLPTPVIAPVFTEENIFIVNVSVGNQIIGSGQNEAKKQAEDIAVENAVQFLAPEVATQLRRYQMDILTKQVSRLIDNHEVRTEYQLFQLFISECFHAQAVFYVDQDVSGDIIVKVQINGGTYGSGASTHLQTAKGLAIRTAIDNLCPDLGKRLRRVQGASCIDSSSCSPAAFSFSSSMNQIPLNASSPTGSFVSSNNFETVSGGYSPIRSARRNSKVDAGYPYSDGLPLQLESPLNQPGYSTVLGHSRKISETVGSPFDSTTHIDKCIEPKPGEFPLVKSAPVCGDRNSSATFEDGAQSVADVFDYPNAPSHIGVHDNTKFAKFRDDLSVSPVVRNLFARVEQGAITSLCELFAKYFQQVEKATGSFEISCTPNAMYRCQISVNGQVLGSAEHAVKKQSKTNAIETVLRRVCPVLLGAYRSKHPLSASNQLLSMSQDRHESRSSEAGTSYELPLPDFDIAERQKTSSSTLSGHSLQGGQRSYHDQLVAPALQSIPFTERQEERPYSNSPPRTPLDDNTGSPVQVTDQQKQNPHDSLPVPAVVPITQQAYSMLPIDSTNDLIIASDLPFQLDSGIKHKTPCQILSDFQAKRLPTQKLSITCQCSQPNSVLSREYRSVARLGHLQVTATVNTSSKIAKHRAAQGMLKILFPHLTYYIDVVRLVSGNARGIDIDPAVAERIYGNSSPLR
uniref:DRBM domain-containing protein n=1 Tax=Spongospora subterranea TaxID=70186 RepID=A0A0H5R7L4_9EUKA|eukprot:CRZ09742.1 hypothetical protein [Spongospora subterranea]